MNRKTEGGGDPSRSRPPRKSKSSSRKPTGSAAKQQGAPRGAAEASNRQLAKARVQFAPQADKIRRLYRLNQAVDYATRCEMGRALIAVRDKMDRGTFGRWCRAEFKALTGWSQRRAQEFMNLARFAKSAHGAH
jgi:hypothetical protein